MNDEPEPEEGFSAEMVGGPFCGGRVAVDEKPYSGKVLDFGDSDSWKIPDNGASLLGGLYVLDGKGKAFFKQSK